MKTMTKRKASPPRPLKKRGSADVLSPQDQELLNQILAKNDDAYRRLAKL